MTSAACPYCNAPLPPLAALPRTARTACPRCGELVPSERFAVAGTGIAAGHPAPTTATAPTVAAPTLAERKRTTARVLLALMGGLAIMTLIFALLTQDLRRRNDHRY